MSMCFCEEVLKRNVVTKPAQIASGCCSSVLAAPLAESDAVELARAFAALADPVRLRLLSLVAEAGEVCSCDLEGPLGKSQPTISHHTKALAGAGGCGGASHPSRSPTCAPSSPDGFPKPDDSVRRRGRSGGRRSLCRPSG